MGLIKSVNDITYELQGQKTEKEKAKLEKIRKERVKNLLYDFFEIQFQALPDKKTTYKKLLEQKDFAISQIKNAYFEEYETKLNDDNISYINQNYFKILNSVKRQYFELEKIKQQEEKETRKRLLKTELYNYFDFRFRRDGNAEATYFEMLNNKMLIIDQLKKEYSTKYDVKLNFENISYLKQNYFKILNSVKRQYFELEKIKQQEEAEQNKTEINAGAWIGGIITTILIIIFLPLLFCLFIIGAALKSI